MFENIVKRRQLNYELLDFSGDWLRVGLAWLETFHSKALWKRIDMFSVWSISFPEVRLKLKPIQP